MAGFFGDIGSSFESGEGFGSAGSGAVAGAYLGSLIAPGVGTGVGAGIGALIGATAGGAMARQRRKLAAAQEAALEQEQKQSLANRNRLVEQAFSRRARTNSMGVSNVLAPGQKNASTQGTSLLVPTATNSPSLFEGS